MKEFKVIKTVYVEDIIYTEVNIISDTGVMFFTFRDNHRKYLNDSYNLNMIRCIPELEPYKNLLAEIFLKLEENKTYQFNEVIKSFIRNEKINLIL